MRFWDSSAVVPLLVTEPTTPLMEGVYREDPVMLLWWAGEVECASALCRLEREGALSGKATSQALQHLDELKACWHEVQPGESLRRVARRLLRSHALRAADALQVAAAVVAAEGDPGSLEVVSLDSRLQDAARREGFRVTDLPAEGDEP